MCGILMLLCGACGGGDGDNTLPDNPDIPDGGGGEQPAPSIDTKLEVYVYTPEHPVITRADIGEVEPETDERAVNSLDIWVFAAQNTEHFQVGDLIGHLSPQVASPRSFEGGRYQMNVSEDFAIEKPNVDVYVMANVTSSNTGLATDWSTVTTKEALDALIIGQNYFGFNPTVTSPPSAGLPMSGVLKNQTLGGGLPLLKVDNPVTVVRAVSKVRFVFSRTNTDVDDILRIKGISLSTDNDVNGMIPQQEYLFLENEYTERAFHINSTAGYEGGQLTPLTGAENIPVCPYPAKYAYTGEKQGQDYEDLINSGITAEPKELAQVGRFYLRESDQKIKGTITYTIGSGEEKHASFMMANEKDFSRNHTWIVFGYFAGKETLQVYSVDVTDWTESSISHEVYNW